jgi:DNA-binding NtrC family response regulator
LVDEGKFRSDFYFRVNVMRIQVPALRDRSEDIPLLANHFLEKYAIEYGKDVDSIHPAAMARLMEYAWPGNVRELENAMARAVIVSEDNSILVRDLPEAIGMDEEDVITIDSGLSGSGNSFEEQLRDYKIKLANRAIVECHGNKTLAAKSLSISRAYLHRLLRGVEGAEETCRAYSVA